MADHRATWARLRKVARQRYPEDDPAAELAARELFDTEETVAYAADLDTRVEEQGVLDTERTATCLRGELREKYVHLDNDDLDAGDLAYLELPTDEEVAESAVEQRALMMSFETQRRNESGRRLMAAKRRAAADELVVSQQSARQSAYLHNLAAEDEARAAAVGRRLQEERVRVAVERRLQEEHARAAELARTREHQYPLLLRRR
jgi:hypothetical protein